MAARRRAWARWRSHVDLSTRGELVASEARGVELGPADAAHRACGALERACDQRRLAHAFASVEHCARRCASAAAAAAGATAARLDQRRALAAPSRRTGARGRRRRWATWSSEDPTRRGPGRRGAGRYYRPRAGAGGGPPEIAGRDRHQRRGAASRAPRAATLGVAAEPRDGRRRSPLPRFRSVAFAEAPPPRASLTPSDESLSSASRDRRDAWRCARPSSRPASAASATRLHAHQSRRARRRPRRRRRRPTRAVSRTLRGVADQRLPSSLILLLLRWRRLKLVVC